MKKAVIITAQNFQDEEFTYPYYRLLEEGFSVEVATPDKAVVYGKYGVPARPTMDTKDLKAVDYDLVVLPGGFEAPDRLRIRKEVLSFVKEMYDMKKLVAAICHGPWICISAGIMKGKKATGYISIADDIRNAGAVYLEEKVVIDGNLITAPHYKNNGDFMKAVIKFLNEK
ncbi:type 1 glutamine amidotransferase [bacterium]|nr:type 1 glutamine amidotransferase [bacterium]MBU3956607.1 type 1 glutamine amidotransferase [bacterium]